MRDAASGDARDRVVPVARTGAVVLLALAVLAVLAAGAVGLAVGSPGLTVGQVTPASAHFEVSASLGERQATVVEDCTTITESGRYVLADDLEDADADSCVEIRADDVLLDGNGHAIDGGSLRQGTAGVEVAPGTENVAVRNLRVSRWAFGVRFEEVSGGEIAGVEARFNADGVHVADSREVEIRSVLTENNFVGVAVSQSTRVAVSDTTARWSAIYGVSVAGSADVTLSNVATDHDEIGIGFFDAAGATVRNATAVSNRVSGLELAETEGTRVSNVAVRANAGESSVRTARGFVAVEATDLELDRTRDTRVSNVTPGPAWSVGFGSDSVNDTVAIRTDSGTVSLSGSGVVVSSVESPPSPPADREALGPVVRTETTAANATLTLTATYSDATLAAANVAESTLVLWRYDGEDAEDDDEGDAEDGSKGDAEDGSEGDDEGDAEDGSDESAWSPVEGAQLVADRNLARATVRDSAVLALLGEPSGDGGDGDDSREPNVSDDAGPVSVTEREGVRVEFACDGVRVSVPRGVEYSLLVHYFDAETGTRGRGLLGPLSGTTEEPFDSEIVFTEVDVLVGGGVLVSGFLPAGCPNAP